jgi:hypothetical protein
LANSKWHGTNVGGRQPSQCQRNPSPKINCAGFAIGGANSRSIEPKQGKCFQDIFDFMNYQCHKGVSALDCEKKCGAKCKKFVMAYLYEKDGRKAGAKDKDLMKLDGDYFKGGDAPTDYHMLSGIPGNPYQFQPSVAVKGSKKDKTKNPHTWTPTTQDPDFFTKPLESYCCCEK